MCGIFAYMGPKQARLNFDGRIAEVGISRL